MTGPCTSGFWRWMVLVLMATTTSVTGQGGFTVRAQSTGYDDPGAHDINFRNSSYIVSNGQTILVHQDVYPYGRGYQAYILNELTGGVVDKAVFDTHVGGFEAAGQLTTFLEGSAAGRIIAIVVHDSVADTLVNLAPYGSTITTTPLGFRESYAMITQKGAKPSWFVEEKSARYAGPTIVEAHIPTVCQDQLGMESGTIPDESITAIQSGHNAQQPHYGRLNETAGWGGWGPQLQLIGVWLQVDLGVIKRVTGTIIQGGLLPVFTHYSWVTSYKLEYSGDETFWTTYADSDGSDKVFTGNTDTTTPVTNLLDNPVDARYVRFYPQTWNNRIAMRVEILGCDTKLLWGLALNDAGMSHLNVSWTVVGNLPISRYTLRYQPADGSGSYQDLSPAPGVDATSATVLGLMDHTEYTLTLTSYDEDDQPNGFINGTYTTVCQDPFGMESGAIPDESITASEFGHNAQQPHLGRLKETAGWGGWGPHHQLIGVWLQVDLGVIKRVTGTITQGGLLSSVHIHNTWVTSYKLEYSGDEIFWTTYADSDGSDKVFKGNTDARTPVTNILDNPVDARYVRFYPQSWHNRIAMRVEILGCDTELDGGWSNWGPWSGCIGTCGVETEFRYRTCNNPADCVGPTQDTQQCPITLPCPVCQDPLGMESGAIPDGSITASSDAIFRQSYNGRLDKAPIAGWNGWSPTFYNIGQWLQVDLGVIKRVTGTVTQGAIWSRGEPWVTSYKLEYSGDGTFWTTYANSNGSDKVFTGNTDDNTIKKNLLDSPVDARFVRFYPQSWSTDISMRVEILGCSTQLLWGMTLFDAGMSHLTVSWTVVGNLPISGYRLRYQPTDGSGSPQYLYPSRFFTSATVRGLQAHTEYTLTLTSLHGSQQNGEITGTFTTVCQYPLGMESGAIPDSSITASGIQSTSRYHQPYFGRLKRVLGWGGWAPAINGIGQWLQVDLGETKHITGTVIQGGWWARYDRWVTSYKLQYSVDGTVWTTYADSGGSEKLFPGNTDNKRPVTNLLDNPVDARFVRFNPQEWNDWIVMRVEILGCTCAGEKATCIAWGDPHFTMFNGRKFDFQGQCRYTLAKDCGNGGDFNIEVRQVRWGHRNPIVSTVNEVYVMAYGYEIAILLDKTVTVTGPPPTLPFTPTLPFSLAMGNIQVTLSGTFVRVDLTEFCVVILYGGLYRVEVKIPSSYQNKMCGLCGNYNGVGNDDFEMPDGNIASNNEEFGNSWLTDSNTCPAGTRRKRQSEEPCDSNYSDPCNVLTDTNGTFAVCHGVVDPQVHFESCVFDECATQGQGEFLCANLEAYYASCRDAGVPSFTWRTSELCPLDCPANSTYSSCTTACPATCANPSAPDHCPIILCVEGCECDPGYVQSGLDCVPEADCGCTDDDGYYHTLGAVWEDDGEECVCNAGDTIVCTEIDGCDPNPCVSNAECTDVPAPGTDADCTCDAGHEGDGQIDGTGCTVPVIGGLTLDDAGISHLSVSWTVVGNLPISRYRLRYQRTGGSYQDLSPAPVTGATSATVSGLLADTEYTLTLTSFDEDGQPNGVISGTYTTDSVVVNVECDQDSMRLSIPRAALLAVNVEDLHLLDPDCGATEDEVEDVFKLETHLQECGTRQETSGDDKFIFSNEVIANQVTHDNGAVRNQPVNLPFQCEFIRQHVVSQGGDILYNIPSPRVQIVDANNSFIIEMRMYTSGDFSASYESSDFPIQVLPSDRLNFGLSVASPLDNLELFARDCVSTPTTNPDDSPSVSIIDDGCQVDQTLQKDNDLSNDKALYYSVAAFTFPNAIDPSLVYFHCTMIICFKDDPDSRCKQGCIPPAGRRRRAVSDGTESRVRRESSRDKQADITQGPFQVLFEFEEEPGTGSAGVPLGTAIGASVGVAGVMVLLIVVVVLVKKRGGLALGRKKRDDDTVGLDNYAFQTWGKMSKTDIADTKA